MGERIRAKNWATTPLGPCEEWPQWLRVTVRLVLDSSFPMVIGVGKELRAIYNDAYRPLLGRKEETLGRPFLEIWSEAREVIEPQIAEMWEGKSHFFAEVPFTLERNGHPEKTWFDYGYWPLRDDSGAVIGLVNITLESTERVEARRQLANLAEELDERVRERTADLEEEVAERKRLQREVRQAADEERRRIGQALHDNLGQELSGLRMLARSHKHRLEKGDLTGAIERAERIEEILTDADKHARQLARQITPFTLDEKELGDVLEDLKKSVEDLHEVYVGLEMDQLPAMPEETVTHLFHLFQEAILNALTHGEAGRINVRLWTESEKIHFEIVDNGVGLSETSEDGLGIRIMRHRAELLGGALSVEPAQEGGTRLQGHIRPDDTRHE